MSRDRQGMRKSWPAVSARHSTTASGLYATESGGSNTASAGPSTASGGSSQRTKPEKDITKKPLGTESYTPSHEECHDAIKLLEGLGLKEAEILQIDDILQIGTCLNKDVRKHAENYSMYEWLQGLLFMDFSARDQRVAVVQGHIKLNPLDQMVLVYPMCSKRFQMLLGRALFKCRLAVPIVIPGGRLGEYCLHLAPFSNITLDVKAEGKRINSAALDAETILVSFVRFGKMVSMSKSNIINKFLKNDNHSTFVHFNSINGNKERKVANGLVETSWRLPITPSSPILTVLNLRGDAYSLMHHFNLLVSGSSVVVCYYNYCSREDNSAIKRVISDSANVHFVFLVGKKYKSKFNRLFGLECLNFSVLELSATDAPDITANRIHKAIPTIGRLSKRSLANLHYDPIRICDYAHDTGISRIVTELMSRMPPGIEQVKQEIFPMQGELWVAYSAQRKDYFQQLQKMVIREGKTEEESRVELDNAIENIFEKHQHMFCNISPIIDMFANTLIDYNNSSDSCHLFLKFLGNALSEKYESYFSIDNFVREFSQMYEAYHYDVSTSSGFIPQLPLMIANLVIDGYQMEILDGNTANIPMNWFQAVLKEVKTVIGEYKKVLVLSILGIQSSGKSTLLNAMFGTQFAVSVGRCTKGVLMQLVKAEQGLPFDYVVVLDTEGLRAPELGSESINRDNELGTFVIGASDVTIINIKGENYNEMKDVIQIVIHALIRMDRGHDKSKRCIFVHQNAQAAYAINKPRVGSVIHEKLDKALMDIRKEVSQSEPSYDNIDIFKLLHFDFEEDAFFLEDFWVGDAPMAYVNPKYSSEALKVRRRITNLYSRCSEHQMKGLSYFIGYVVDLWHAILEENFVFTFRNCREIRLYKIMENAYNNSFQTIQSTLDDWEKKYVEGKMIEFGCSDGKLQRYHTRFNAQLEVLHSLTKSIVQHFYNVCRYLPETHIIEQWLPDKRAALEAERRDLVQQYFLRGESCIANEISLLHVKTQEQRHRQNMLTRARDVGHIQGQMGIPDLKQKFEELWSEMLTESRAASTPEPKSSFIKNAIEKAMISTFYSDARIALHSLNMVANDDSHSVSNMHDLQFLTPADALTCSRVVVSEYVRTRIAPEIKRFIRSITASTYFKHSMFFDYVNRIKKLCQDANLYCNKFRTNITLHSRFQTDIAAIACKIATPTFCSLYERLVIRRQFAFKIKDHKERMWIIFRDAAQNIDLEFTVPDLVTKQLEEVIVANLEKIVNDRVLIYLKGQYSDKKRILSGVLVSLAKHGNFELYLEYMNDPSAYSMKWLELETIAIRNKYITGQSIDEIFKSVNQCFEQLSHGVTSMRCSAWVNGFWRDLSYKLSIEKAYCELTTLPDTACINKIERFHQSISESFPSIRRRLHDLGQRIGGTDHVCRQFVTNMWACYARCPFCSEPCCVTSHDHDHMCYQHSILGFRGHLDKRKLVIKNCNYMVGKSRKTYVKDGRNHSYRKYKQYHPKWIIEPWFSKTPTRYWQWFLVTFHEQLVGKYGCKKISISSHWERITSVNAIMSLPELETPMPTNRAHGANNTYGFRCNARRFEQTEFGFSANRY